MSKNKSRDFKLGNTGENRVIDILTNFGFSCTKNTDLSTQLYYDILVKDLSKNIGDFTIEVKNDFFANRSGNIAIEYFNSSKHSKSGIAATKANLWVHITDKVYVTSVQALKQYITDNKPFKQLKHVGDGNACIYLYKIDQIIPCIFHNIENISKSYGRSKIRNLL